MNLKNVAFIDMHARHSTGDDLSLLAAYGAAKAGVVHLTKSLALELEKRGYDWVKQEASAA